jgi:hypothetical protein
VKRLLGWDPPEELEEAAPPRFANTMGLAFTAVASILYFVFHEHAAAWTLGVLVSVLALLAATTGLCIGCEFYVAARRFAVSRRERAGAGV